MRADASAIAGELDDGIHRAAGARSTIAALYVLAAASRALAAAMERIDSPARGCARHLPPLCARSRRARGVRPKLSPAAATRTQGLPNVDPVYTWVRLAQRVPMRIRIDHVPSEVTLVAGMTATVVVGDGREGQPAWVQAVRDRLFGSPSRTEPGAERKN